jgi:hypothetical protein
MSKKKKSHNRQCRSRNNRQRSAVPRLRKSRGRTWSEGERPIKPQCSVYGLTGIAEYGHVPCVLLMLSVVRHAM